MLKTLGPIPDHIQQTGFNWAVTASQMIFSLKGFFDTQKESYKIDYKLVQKKSLDL